MSSLVAWDMELLPTKRLFWMRLLHGRGGVRARTERERQKERKRERGRTGGREGGREGGRSVRAEGEHVQAGHGRPARARTCHRRWLGAEGQTHSESVALLLPSKPSFTLS